MQRRIKRYQLKLAQKQALALLAVLLVCLLLLPGQLRFEPTFNQDFPPLVMRGGDPFVRALMRTISASEANDSQPYSIVYGGTHVHDLSHHPALCVKIVAGPNQGQCSTAAGRYQLLDTTWFELAQRYHPLPSKFLFWKSYSFEPVYQDQVVYAWLKDSRVWGLDIPQQLRLGKLNLVRQRLSSTWTSLGYGIENNSMTGQLSKIYQKLLQRELQISG